ncbi:efflux RND transporter periplasmic adaptor subunit [Deinococcus fonticola]|uniref:efflux RND transporter periplasmic adaptor subunit n=1 Tax=Deinococcus fonticola TaxID=2528713 RepID=UPI001074AA77|nr:HlyD family efflux transporter periplasmic adaptor subunit [Deinococcus fonticola]
MNPTSPPSAPERPATAASTSSHFAASPGPVRRRGVFRWILVPLLVAGVGFAGYRLGQSSPGSSGASQAGAGFGGASGTGGRNAAGGGSATGARNGTGAATGAGEAGSAQGGGAAGPSGWSGRGSGNRTSGAATSSEAGAGNAARTGRSGEAGAGQAQSGQGQRGQAGAQGSQTGGGVVTPVSATEIKAGTLTTQRRLSGTVSATQSTTVNARVTGVVRSVKAGVGDQVSGGQEVLVVSSPDLQSAVQTAESNLAAAQQELRSRQRVLTSGRVSLQQAITSAQNTLNNARKQLNSLQQLYAVGAVARSEVDAQQVAVSSAQSALLTAQSNLTDTTQGAQEDVSAAQLSVQKAQIALQQAQRDAAVTRLTAPYAGTLTAVNLSEGETVSSGTPAFTLVSSTLAVKVNVPATEAASLPAGTELKFVVGQQTYPLKVAQVGGGTTGSVPVTARFTAERLPASGTVGSVIYTAKVGQGILVPSTALLADNDKTYVFVIQAGKAQRTQVTVLGQAGTQSVVQGIPSGVQVITQPPSGLVSGSSVTTSNGGGARQGSFGAGGPPEGAP